MILQIWLNSMSILKGNWLKVVLITFMCNVLKIITGTNKSLLSFDGHIKYTFASFSTTDRIFEIVIGALVTSVCFFTIVDLINNIKLNLSKKTISSLTVSFKHRSMLIKGFIISFISSILLYITVFGILLSVLNLSAILIIQANINALDVTKGLAVFIISLLILWTYLGISQSMYVLYDNPSMSISRCIRNSLMIMRGNRLSFIALNLSFIGCLLLGLLALVVGILWSLAYIEVARFEFYNKIKGDLNSI